MSVTTGFAITPNLQQIYAALVPFIATVTGLPAENIVQGLPNRASMPLPGFIQMQAVDRRRLATNLHQLDETDASPISAGIVESIELTLQIDCFGPQSTAEIVGAEDWANLLSATLRDEYGCTQLSPTLAPLYADEARMVPLVDAEKQYEERWMVQAHFEIDPTTTIPQQYADALALVMVNVEEAYPA